MTNFPSLDREQALALVHLDESTLLQSATTLRQRVFGNAVSLCAIINARSGQCSMDCAFCSQSTHHRASITVFDMLSVKELHERIAQYRHMPLARVGIVTGGGHLPMSYVERIATVLQTLPEHWVGRVCASLGKLPRAALRCLQEAGLQRFHHNLESSENYYPKLCTTQTWQERLETVIRTQESGLHLCCGGLFGLGETWEDRIDLALSLRAHNICDVPINFLHPHKGTPLGHMPLLSAYEALRIIAVFRHILPTATLRVCGGRPSVLGVRQKDIFAAGANALMTGHYLTTSGKAVEEDCRMIEEQGLEITL